MSCSKCNGVILADTEDWEKPLCHTCYCTDEYDLATCGACISLHKARQLLDSPEIKSYLEEKKR